MKIEVKRAFFEGGVTGVRRNVGEVINVSDEFGRLMIASGKAEETTKELTKKGDVVDTTKKGGSK